MNKKKIINAIIVILLLSLIFDQFKPEGSGETYIEVIYKRSQGGEQVLIVNETDNTGRVVLANEIFVIDNPMAYKIIEMGDKYWIYYEIHNSKRYLVDIFSSKF